MDLSAKYRQSLVNRITPWPNLSKLSLPGFYITWPYRFASHLTTVGPISTLCKAAELPPGRMPLQGIRSLYKKDRDVGALPYYVAGGVIEHAAAGDQRKYPSQLS
jgi:hypothetical protein